MELLEQFENPLPILKTELDKITVETSSVYEGNFFISNEGGSVLEGKILSNTKAISFSPDRFRGNKTRIYYKINSDILKEGDFIRSSAMIMSNGGEKTIMIVLKIIPPAIILKGNVQNEDIQIGDLKDFLTYAMKQYQEAVKFIGTKEFRNWLKRIDFEYIDIFESIMKDTNKERALDNFLILAKLKKKATAVFLDKDIYMESKPGEHLEIEGVLNVKIVGWGYLDTVLVLEMPTATIQISIENLNSKIYEEGEELAIPFKVFSSLMKGKIEFNSFILKNIAEQDFKIPISIIKKNMVDIKLSKESFAFEDHGTIMITNHWGSDVSVDIIPKDSFVKIDAKRYFISDSKSIGFNIKLTTFLLAQLSFKKQPTIKTEILFKTIAEDTVYTKKIEFTVGDYKL